MFSRTAYCTRPLTAFCLLLLLTALLSGCRRETLDGKLAEGEIAVTFDDAAVENWYRHLPLLDSLNIKATFYVSHYHTLNRQQKAWLKEIEKQGHEIAYHTANHLDLSKEAARKGIELVERREVMCDLQLMRADGFDVNNFAYPYGSHSGQWDDRLLGTFKSVRALSNKKNYRKSLVKEAGDHKVLYGANVDNNSRLTEDGLRSLLDDARNFHTCLVLVAHEINNPNVKLRISRERLIMLSKAAAERGLKFITVNEIVR